MIPIDALMNNLTAVSQQISGLVDDNRTQLKPALDKLNGVLGILDNRKQELQRTLYLLRRYAMSFGEVLGAGTVLQGLVVNLRPASSPSRSSTPHSPTWVWTPTCCCRRNSSTRRRPARHPGAAGALPAHRPGRRSASDICPTRSPATPAIRAAVRPACRCPAPPAAIRTASRCPRRRPAGRRRGRPRSGPHQVNCRRRRSGRRCPRPQTEGSEHVEHVPLRIAMAAGLVVILAVAITVVATPWWDRVTKDTFVAYFANANGLYTGDEVRILGVAVGTIEAIDPQPNRTKVTFSVDRKYPVPADAKAAILSPSLVSARAIQLVPRLLRRSETRCGRDDSARAHRGAGRVGRLPSAAGEAHRHRCNPRRPAGVSPVGEFINTAADNLRGNGDTARDTVIKLSQAVSALGDHSTDIFSTVRNLQLLVSALTSSSDLLAAFNTNLADVTTVLSNTPNEVPTRRRVWTAR